MHTYIHENIHVCVPQVEEDKGSAEDAMKKLQDALKYMNTGDLAPSATSAASSTGTTV